METRERRFNRRRVGPIRRDRSLPTWGIQSRRDGHTCVKGHRMETNCIASNSYLALVENNCLLVPPFNAGSNCGDLRCLFWRRVAGLKRGRSRKKKCFAFCLNFRKKLLHICMYMHIYAIHIYAGGGLERKKLLRFKKKML